MCSSVDFEEFHNVKIKSYPSGLSKLTISSWPIFRDKADLGGGIDADSSQVDFGDDSLSTQKKRKPKCKAGENTRNDSLKRARDKVFDISMANDFHYFITWTLDKKVIDRYDVKAFSKRLRVFLHDRVQLNNLKYLVIPELHKDGAVHVHGLCSGDIKLVDSGYLSRSGQTIYNMPQWKLGFSSVIKVYGSPESVCSYITKYITKDGKMIFGNYYWAGGDIKREAEVHLSDMDYKDLESKEYLVEGVGIGFKYLNIIPEKESVKSEV